MKTVRAAGALMMKSVEGEREKEDFYKNECREEGGQRMAALGASEEKCQDDGGEERYGCGAAAGEEAHQGVVGWHGVDPYWRFREVAVLLPLELVRVRLTAESEVMDWVKLSFWT